MVSGTLSQRFNIEKRCWRPAWDFFGDSSAPILWLLLFPCPISHARKPFRVAEKHAKDACYSCLPLHRPRGGLVPQRSRCVRSQPVDFPLHVIFAHGAPFSPDVVPRARSGRPVTRLHPRATVFHDRESPRCGRLGRTLFPVVHPSRTVLRRAPQRTRSEIPNCI